MCPYEEHTSLARGAAAQAVAEGVWMCRRNRDGGIPREPLPSARSPRTSADAGEHGPGRGKCGEP